jgi:hypothetical protein
MNDHLSIALRSYLERSQRSALDVERRAGLPNAFIAGIMRGTHPRPKSMSALLSAVPQEEAILLLIAYLRDDCPDDWEDKIQIDIIVCSMQEPATPYGPTRPATIEEALAALTRAAQGDTHLRDWIITTAHILNLLPAADLRPNTEAQRTANHEQ